MFNGMRRILGILLLTAVFASALFPVKALASTTNPEPQGTLGYDVKKGDVNNDGEVDAADVTTGLKVITGIYEEATLSRTAGDVDDNGALSVRDALQILENVEGIRDDALGIEKLPDVAYYVPEMYQEGSSFLSADKTVGFYGADGYGKYTTGGRGGKVIYVTNLNDSGEGSFRAACEASGARMIVFRVSGTIHLKSQIRIKNGNVTIAGETAPGDGITLVNYPLSIDNADNVIIRYLSMRSGDWMQAMGLYNGGEYGVDSLTISSSKNVIIDHCAATWGTDETLSVTTGGTGYADTTDNLSVQWSIIADSLSYSANVGTRLGLASLTSGNYGSKYTFHHNLYASHNSRMPELCSYVDYRVDEGNFQYEFINNAVYNWGGNTAGKSPDHDQVTYGQIIHVLRYDFINNYYKTGETSGPYIMDEASFGNQMYAEGNTMDGGNVEDQLSLIWFTDDILQTKNNAYYMAQGLYLDKDTLMYKGSEDFNYSYWKGARFEDSMMENIQSAQDAYEDVLAQAGASLSRGSLDIGLTEGVADGTAALVNYPYESAGWSTGKPPVTIGKAYGEWLDANYPKLASYTPYVDSDGDGMSDAWEDFMKSQGFALDKNDPTDGAASYMGTSYTNLDVFLQFLVENPAAAIAK